MEGLVAAAFVGAFCLLESFVGQLELVAERGGIIQSTLASIVGTLVPVYGALGALGALTAVVYPSMRGWALLLVLGVVLVVRHSLNLYLGIRINYQATLRALAEAIEAQDPAVRGHSERTADMAMAVGRELGMRGRQLETLSYAALLHDIGKLATPEDTLDALMDEMSPIQATDRFHAERGAEILGQVEYLEATAELVRYHHHPYEPAGRRGQQVPLGARVIAACSFYDKLTHPEDPDLAMRPEKALGRMRKDVERTFDPAVLRALGSVAVRQSA